MSKLSLDIKDAFDPAEEQFFKLKGLLSSGQAKKMRLSIVASVIDDEGRELWNRLLQGHIDERGLGDIGDSVTGSDGIVLSSQTNPRSLHKNLIWNHNGQTNWIFKPWRK